MPVVAASSRPRGWLGVELLRARIDENSLDVEGLGSHTLALNVGVSFRLEGRVDGRRVGATMHPNTLKVVPAGPSSRWRWRAEGAIDMLHMSVSDTAVSAFYDECELRPHEIRTAVGVVDDAVARLAAAFDVELAAEYDRGRLYAESLAQDLVAHLVGTFSTTGRSQLDPPGRIGNRAMLELDAYIDAHLGDDISLERLAAVACLSRFHFTRLFRRTVRSTPYQYVLERRLTRAARLIRATALPLRDVAAAVGFADQSHLTRLVRGRYGTTPAKLRSDAR